MKGNNDPVKVRSFYNERWVPVSCKAPTKQNNYEISDYGRIKSITKATGNERLLKGSIMGFGFVLLNLRLKDNIKQSIYVHRFVAEHFVEKEYGDQTFLVHINGEKKNNHFGNLKWLNQKELTAWQKETGVLANRIAARSLKYKMNETKVKLLKARYKKGKTKRSILAKQFNITEVHVERIIKGEYWAHVK